MNTNFEIVLSFSCKLLNFPSSSRDPLQARIGFILENWMSHYSDNMRSWTMPGKHYTVSLSRLLKQLTNNMTIYQYRTHQTLPNRGTASTGKRSWMWNAVLQVSTRNFYSLVSKIPLCMAQHSTFETSIFASKSNI